MGMILRLIGFPHNPVSLYWDEMAIWNDARSIWETGRDLHNRSWFQPLFISYGDYKLPIYIWLVSLARAFPVSSFAAVRLPSLLAGVSMIPGVAILIRQWRGEKRSLFAWQPWSLAAAFFLAILPWSWHFSRVGFEGHLSAAWVLWSTIALFQAHQEQRIWRRIGFFLIASILGTLAVYTYFSTRFVWPIIFGMTFLLWLPRTKNMWWQYAIAGILWAMSLWPMYNADFYQESNRFRLSTPSILTVEDRPMIINSWRERAGNGPISRVLFNKWTFMSGALATNMASHLSPDFLFLRGEQNLRHGSGDVGLMFIWMAPFFVIGWGYLFRQNWRLAVFLFGWWMVALVPASVPLSVPHALRSLNAVPVFPVVLGAGVLAVWQWLGQQTRHHSVWRFALTSLFVLVAGVSLTRHVFYLVKVYPRLSATNWQDGLEQAAQYAAAHRDEYYEVWIHEIDGRFFLYYQPYSGYSWKEIQAMPSQDFARSTFGNVFITPIPDWAFLHPNTLVITQREKLPASWSVVDVIRGADGRESFVVTQTVRQ